MIITFNSMGYDYISKICFDFLKRIIPHTSLGLVFVRLSKINKLVRNITRADKLVDLFYWLKD